MKNYDDSLKALRMAKKLEPDTPDINFYIAKIYWKKGQMKKALNTCDMAI